MDDEELIEVKLIRRKGAAVLVEFEGATGSLERVSVRSADFLEEGGSYFVSSDKLDIGIPHGVPFEDLLPEKFEISSRHVVTELHEAGIWTVEDYEANSSKVRSIILSVNRGVLANLNSVVRTVKRRN